MEIIRPYRMKGEGMEMADMGYVIIDRMGRIRYDPIIRVLRQLNREIGASSERAEKPSAM